MAEKEPAANLEELVKSVGEAVKAALRGVRAVVVFGSALRPRDFAPGLSDVDVLALVDEPGRRRLELEVRGVKVNVSLMRPRELEELFDLGDPLSFMLHRSRKILLDDGTFARISARAPEATERTAKILRRSVFVAIGLALERYFSKDYRRAVSHAYHAVRHMARYKAVVEGAGFPVSDGEASRALEGEARSVFAKLVKLRRRAAGGGECLEALDEALKAIASELGYKKPNLRFVKNYLRERWGPAEVTVALVKEKEDAMAVRIEAFTADGIKKLEFVGNEVKAIGRILN